MSIQSVSFWQFDQSWWQQQQQQAQYAAAENTLISAMASAQTNLSSGLSSIANNQALTRVNNQITADEKALSAPSGSGSSSSSSSASSSSSGPAPATAIGTVPLTASTPLSTLGIPPKSTITVSAGNNTTRYSSTGTDTVADLIGAINNGSAFVNASLNSSGKLVITGRDDKESVSIGGIFASDVGFGPGHQNFQPTAGSSSSSSNSASSSSSSTSSPASTSSTSSASQSGTASGTSSTSKSTTVVPSLASENASSAASFLSDFGVAGSLVDMLA